MKSLFYKIGFTVLIIAGVLSVTGGVAAAASPDNSLIVKMDAIRDVVENIQAKVANIWAYITDENTGFPSVRNQLDSIETKVDTIASGGGPTSAMDSGSGKLQLEYSGYVNVGPGFNSYSASYESSYEGTVGHVTLTVRVPMDISVDAYADDSGEFWKISPATEIVGVSGYSHYTFEFDGPNFMVQASTLVEDDGDPYNTPDQYVNAWLSYYYTYSYPSQAQ